MIRYLVIFADKIVNSNNNVVIIVIKNIMAKFVKIEVLGSVLREATSIVEYFNRKLVVYEAK